MLTQTTIKTYNKLLSKEKPLIEMFFDIGISLAVKHPKEEYFNTLVLSLAKYTDKSEANMHIKQIMDFYNGTVDTFEALSDENKHFKCDEVMDALVALEDFETTREALHKASSNMLEVLIDEFDLQEAIEPILYVEMVNKVESKFKGNEFYAEQFLSLLDVNTMLRKGKGANEDDVNEFSYKMYALCQHFNLYRKKSINSIGRNDSCPCGSGKKYKKCCL